PSSFCSHFVSFSPFSCHNFKCCDKSQYVRSDGEKRTCINTLDTFFQYIFGVFFCHSHNVKHKRHFKKNAHKHFSDNRQNLSLLRRAGAPPLATPTLKLTGMGALLQNLIDLEAIQEPDKIFHRTRQSRNLQKILPLSRRDFLSSFHLGGRALVPDILTN
uniref:hypothetical protein n=1 Tax=Streptococcus suis TaxID=1307 RepID=UPI001EE06BA6